MCACTGTAFNSPAVTAVCFVLHVIHHHMVRFGLSPEERVGSFVVVSVYTYSKLC
jgi:hypothetical protein